MKTSICVLLLASIVTLVADAAAERAQASDLTSDLLAKLPDSVNAVGVIRLEELLTSPRACEEGWALQYEVCYLSGALVIPPTVQTVVLGARFDPVSQSRIQEFGIARLKKRNPFPIREFARANQAEMEVVAGKEVALSIRHGYVAEIETGVIGGVAPPNRQEFARWLQFSKTNKQPVISAYLREAVESKPSAQILLAVDLQEMANPKSLHAWLVASDALKNRQAELADMEKLLLGLKGMRFTATVEKMTHGQVWFDFSQKPTENQAELILPMFQVWMRDAGAVIEDLADPGVHIHVVKQSVLADLIVSDSSLRRIMTLLPQPSVAMQSASAGDQAPGQGAGLIDQMLVNRWYFQSIDSLLDELHKAANKSKSYAQFTLWHETFARKIDQLPTAQIDPELSKYGASIATHLRALALSLRGVAMQMEGLEGQKRFYYYQEPPRINYSWGGWGGYYGGPRPPVPPKPPLGPYWYPGWSWGAWPGNTYYSDNFAEIRSKQAEAVAKGEADRTAIWSQIEHERQGIRQKMLERFKTDFAEKGK
jgi:hypothetical protein